MFFRHRHHHKPMSDVVFAFFFSFLFSFVLERYPFIVIALNVSLSHCTLHFYSIDEHFYCLLYLRLALLLLLWFISYMEMFFDAFNILVVIFTLTITFFSPSIYSNRLCTVSLQSQSLALMFYNFIYSINIAKCLSIQRMCIHINVSEFIDKNKNWNCMAGNIK